MVFRTSTVERSGPCAGVGTLALITSGGGPGVWGLLSALRTVPNRAVTVLVHDPSEDATLGTLCADGAVRLPAASEPGYVDALLNYCRDRRVEVLLPVYDGELLAVARRRSEFDGAGTAVLLPPTEVVEVCRDKARTYAALAGTSFAPEFRRVDTLDETLAAIAALGYPGRVLAVRPLDLAGGRGLHVLTPKADAFAAHFLEKPGAHQVTAEEFLRIRAKGPHHFPLLVTEYLPGEELGVDLMAEAGRAIEMVIRRKSGPMLHGNPACIEFAERPAERSWVAELAAALRLSGLVSIDARYDAGGTLRLLEVNPRPGAYVGMSCERLHLLGWAIDRLLGDRTRGRANYVGDESITHGLRAFGDLTRAAQARRSAILSPVARAAAAEPNQELGHARRLPCRTPG